MAIEGRLYRLSCKQTASGYRSLYSNSNNRILAPKLKLSEINAYIKKIVVDDVAS